MKLTHFEQHEAYQFSLTFENGEFFEADLQGLIGRYVTEDSLVTARLDKDWGCLEFLDGRVDIEPKTLYRYVRTKQDIRAA